MFTTERLLSRFENQDVGTCILEDTSVDVDSRRLTIKCTNTLYYHTIMCILIPNYHCTKVPVGLPDKVRIYPV